MNFHLGQDGQNVGVFSLEELQRRRAAGELKGTELVWCEGMPEWQPLNSVLPPIPSGFASAKMAAKKPSFLVPAIILGLALAGTAALGLLGYQIMRKVQPMLKQLAISGDNNARTEATGAAMAAASKPVVINPHARTEADVLKSEKEFRIRQYVEGYQLRGDRNPECDAQALGLLTNWIAYNYGGTINTNLPSLAEMSDDLATNPACTDPLVLTIAAINSVELHEAVRRLERAVKGFENSKHLGYPKFYATVTLASKLVNVEPYREAALDAQALQDLRSALADGSIRPEDQADLADTLTQGWGSAFFNRNANAVYLMMQSQGDSCRWLTLTLKGCNEINLAWQARGDGYANQISTAGWQGFNDHLASARQCLTQAWQLQPDQPLAPGEMICVSLGDSDISEMRLWFDRTVTAQFDYPLAWHEMRWGLRPRWYGDTRSMLAFGLTALNTRRFDTDVPRVYFDSVSDVESEMGMSAGSHILYEDKGIWPHLQEMYEGYINESSAYPSSLAQWRSTYAVVAYFAENYDVARKQLEALNWQPNPRDLTGWFKDLSIMTLEVAALTSPASSPIQHADEIRKFSGDNSNSLAIFNRVSRRTDLDERTMAFIHDRQYTLTRALSLDAGEWVDYLPTDANFTGWAVEFGNCRLLPDGALEVGSDRYGHLLYSRVPLGADFEVRGQFEVVSSTTKAFQAGLVMGVPQYDAYDWYAFRMKRNADEGDVASFSEHWSRRQIVAHLNLDSQTNSFYFRYHAGRVSATVNGQEVFADAPPPRDTYVTTPEFLLGLGAFSDSNHTVIRYRNVQVHKLAP